MKKDKLKFKIKRFNDKENFTLWKEMVKDILVDREPLKTLSEKHGMKAVDWMEIQDQVLITIK